MFNVYTNNEVLILIHFLMYKKKHLLVHYKSILVIIYQYILDIRNEYKIK